MKPGIPRWWLWIVAAATFAQPTQAAEPDGSVALQVSKQLNRVVEWYSPEARAFRTWATNSWGTNVLTLLVKEVATPDPLLEKQQLAVKAVLYDKESISAWRRRSLAHYAFSAFGPEGKAAVPGLVELLSSTHVEVRQYAALCLQEIEQGATGAVPALLETLHDKNRYVRIQSAEALAYILGDSKVVVPWLVSAYRLEREGGVRRSIVKAIAMQGPEAQGAQETILVALKDPDTVTRGMAAWAVAEVELPAEIAVPALMASLKDQYSGARYSAAQALQAYGTRAQAAIPLLKELLNDTDRTVPGAARRALEAIDPENYPKPSPK